MASRPLIAPHSVITDGDMASDIISEVTIITNSTLVCYAVSWAGTSPLGECQVQVSNDYKVNAAGTVQNAGTWTTLTLSATATVSGNTGTGVIELASLASYAIRLRYARTSGSGTLQAVLTAKVQ